MLSVPRVAASEEIRFAAVRAVKGLFEGIAQLPKHDPHATATYAPTTTLPDSDSDDSDDADSWTGPLDSPELNESLEDNKNQQQQQQQEEEEVQVEPHPTLTLLRSEEMAPQVIGCTPQAISLDRNRRPHSPDMF